MLDPASSIVRRRLVARLLEKYESIYKIYERSLMFSSLTQYFTRNGIKDYSCS